MATYKVHWKASTRKVQVLPTATATPAGFTNIGSFDHGDDADDELGNDGASGTENHVIYHHVRDALYSVGEQNMQTVDIETVTL